MQHKSGFTAQTFAIAERSHMLLPALHLAWAVNIHWTGFQIKVYGHGWF